MIDPYYLAYFSLTILTTVLLICGLLWFFLRRNSQKFLSYNDIRRLREEFIGNIKRLFLIPGHLNQPKLILAVNKGGITLTSYIREALPKLEENNFLICSVPLPLKQKAPLALEECEIKTLNGDSVTSIDDYLLSQHKDHCTGNKPNDTIIILIIDDVCRSGTSIVRAKKHFEKNTSKTVHFYVATLVSSKNAKTKINTEKNLLGFSTTHETSHDDTRLPWHRPINDPYIAHEKTEALELLRKYDFFKALRELNITQDNDASTSHHYPENVKDSTIK